MEESREIMKVVMGAVYDMSVPEYERFIEIMACEKKRFDRVCQAYHEAVMTKEFSRSEVQKLFRDMGIS